MRHPRRRTQSGGSRSGAIGGVQGCPTKKRSGIRKRPRLPDRTKK